MHQLDISVYLTGCSIFNFSLVAFYATSFANKIDMPGKTNKSFAKRFRITKNGKIIHRTPHQSHFRAKRSGKVIRGLRIEKSMSKNDVKNITNQMPFN